MRTIKTTLWKLSALPLLLAWCLSTAAQAEEPVEAPPAPPAGIPPVPTPDKTFTLTAIDENYVFDENGRRDPFTFTKNVVSLDSGNGNIGVVDQGGGPLAKEVIEKKKSNAELALNLAEGALMELDPNAAIDRCKTGMDEFKDIPDLTKYPELEVVKGRLIRAQKASDQMRGRQTAERDFKAMNIQINGVMATSKKNSQAIINKNVVKKGELVQMSADASDVMVDEILPERVVFIFRGYRMTLLLSEAGGSK